MPHAIGTLRLVRNNICTLLLASDIIGAQNHSAMLEHRVDCSFTFAGLNEYMDYKSIVLCTMVAIVVSACANRTSVIDGVWKHTEKPAWIGIRFEGQIGSAWIARHDENEDALDLTIMEDIQRDRRDPGRWRAKIYSAEVDGYVPAMLVLHQEGELVISAAEEGGVLTEVLRLIRDPDVQTNVPAH